MQNRERADPAREFLNRYWELRQEEKRLERKIEELETQCRNVTAKYRAVPGGAGGGNNVWDALIEAKERAEQGLAEALKAEKEIEKFIAKIPKPKHRQVLRYRYLDLLKWEPIAEKMNYCRRQADRIHEEAIRSAQELWTKQGR